MIHHKFERIDKGQKRTTTTAGKPLPLSIINQGSLDGVDLESILERIAQGEHQNALAAELGVSPPALHYKLKPLAQRHLDARELGLEARLTASEVQIESATDPLNLARARERFRAVAWRCEREFPGRWGQKQEVKHTGNVGPLINIQLSAGLVVADTPNAALLPPISSDEPK